MNSHRLLAATRPAASAASTLASNRVIRNTYWLLALTLAFSAVIAGVSAALKLPHPGLVLTLLGYFGLLYLTSRFRDRVLGLGFVFALTGFMGYTLGPIVSAYLSLPNGHQIVITAMGATAATFFGLSAYALVSRRDFSFLGGFLFAGILVAFLGGLAAIFLELPALSLAVSAAFVLLMAGLILFETSRLVDGGETNYIMATVSLYVAIYNLFLSLMHLLGFGGSGD